MIYALSTHNRPFFFLFQVLKQIYLLFEITLRKDVWIRLNPRFSVVRRNLGISAKTPPFCFPTKFEVNGFSGYRDVYPGRLNI